jgi:hypothetical protein
MQKITDLQICGCVMLKYALENEQHDLIIALLVNLLIELEMDYGLVLSVLSNIDITENKNSFVFEGELDKYMWKILKKRGISLNR